MKSLILFLFFALSAFNLEAHEGHDHAGTFEPPHGGAFRGVVGHVLEVYDADGRLYVCIFERDGSLPESAHGLKDVRLTLKARGRKDQLIEAGNSGKDFCVNVALVNPPALLRVGIKASVGFKMIDTEIAYETGSALTPGKKPVAVKKIKVEAEKSWFSKFKQWLSNIF